jgi:hypothetical protein
MSPTRNQIYRLADRIFFDGPSRMCDEESTFPAACRTAPAGGCSLARSRGGC